MHPYKSLPQRSFWRRCLSADGAFDLSNIWDPKFPISRHDKISTYGSCFAQHIGKALVANGFNWVCTEPPIFGMSQINAQKYGYGLFSSRTGNIYTPSQMLQWTEWAMDSAKMPDEIWGREGHFYDAMRPNLEPDGFANEAEVVTARKVTCAAVKDSIVNTNTLIFTLGLTETWINKITGVEYGICPSPEVFDPDNHVFLNMGYQQVEDALKQAIVNLRKMNPTLNILLTVSPVPLVATATGGHVLAATTHSKSILRAVAGQAALRYDFVDYFPSYEIINSPTERIFFFEDNLRRVNGAGVARVMDIFFGAQRNKFGELSPESLQEGSEESSIEAREEAICEEEILAAFGDKP